MINVIVAVTGGIAAYKSPEIVRRLKDHGAEVQVVMTAAACEFVSPLVFQAVSGHPVHRNLLDEQAEAGMGHIELARWADIILIAPATANTLSRLAAGMADDLLATVCLASRAALVIAPAMNSVMWEHPATQTNLEVLRHRGTAVLGPGVGAQACGEVGEGRLLEPDDIVQSLVGDYFSRLGRAPHEAAGGPNSAGMQGLKLMITAGPTREAIDPVRFISNHSSGKMGFALARAAENAGAEVTLVAGPVSLRTPDRVNRVDVESAVEMHAAVLSRAAACDVFISVAAVADYRAADVKMQKIKKTSGALALALTRNPDILAEVASLPSKPFCVGFAAETQALKKYARGKLAKKNLDMIVANLVGGETGFNSDNNAVEVYWANDGEVVFSSRSKDALAVDLVALIATRFKSSLTDPATH